MLAYRPEERPADLRRREPLVKSMSVIDEGRFPIRTRWFRPRHGESVAGEETAEGVRPDDDPHRLAALRYYPSLMNLAEEVRKPMFALRAADGGIGGHVAAVAGCRREFAALARRIADRCGIEMED